MIDKELLERLYTSYGFEVKKQSDEVYVFVYTKSRYFGVDIIQLSEDKETLKLADDVKESYSKLGYAVNQKKINSNVEAEIELFKSFFSFESSIERLKRKYNDFKNKQTKNLLGYEYQYVESPFDLQNHVIYEEKLFEIIDNRLISKNPELIIIEAAAGYGKTCTAYEIMNRIANNTICQTPIFTELSRNRGIKKFRYILLDEIDLEYSSLGSTLVIKEIKNGRIPLIIDGFDELLEKVNTESEIDSSFEEVETMLDTIGNLLEHNAKIILTTRKTAIFTGEEFESWLQKWDTKFFVTRISLKEPRLKDWMGADKYQLINDKNIPVQYLANPVILSFLKNIDFNDFAKLMDHPELLVEQYFEKMLEREKIRQHLIMTVEKQLEVFRNVVKMLIELDSTSEEKEFFKQMIFDTNKRLIEYTISLYSGEDRQTVDSLVGTLATHALLDRKGRDENQIGFINDFVLGTFVGQILLEPSIRIEKGYSAYMIELAVTAYRVQNRKNKSILWLKIQNVLNKFQSVTIFTFDIYLKESLVRDYIELSIYDISFFNIVFQTHSISSSVFLNCYFKNCVFESRNLHGVSFINCTFDNCSISDDITIDGKNEITAIKCKQLKCSILIERNPHFELEEHSLVNSLEREILIKLSDISLSKGHHIVKLTGCFEKSKSKDIYMSLKKLEEKGLIDVNGIHVRFVTNKIPVIKKIIGLNNEV